jgi:integrase/recombinase XerD
MRYSYANTCRKLGYSQDLIGQALGHSSHGNQITSIYLEHFDNEVIDEMNQQVVNTVLKTND